MVVIGTALQQRLLDAAKQHLGPNGVRYQVNDLLLGGEGMLHTVDNEFALVNEQAVAPDAAARDQFEAARPNAEFIAGSTGNLMLMLVGPSTGARERGRPWHRRDWWGIRRIAPWKSSISRRTTGSTWVSCRRR